MRSWKATIVIAVIILIVAGNWIATRLEPVPPTPSQVPEIKPPVAPVTETTPFPDSTPPTAEPAAPPPRSEQSRAASRRALESPLVSSYPPSTPPPRKAADTDPDVAADFDKVSLMLRDHRNLTGENPVGTNAEIMKAIMGGNPKGAQLGPPEGQTLNEHGELIDRWGTPYFFHQLTRDLMEIHSAGPDRRMGNEDDLIAN
jgi:hypothetical protein